MYPDRNPFPAQAVTTIEGVDWSAIMKQPTLLRGSMKLLDGIALSYANSRPESRSGRAVAVHGEHGTGKTFSLLHALASPVVDGRSGAPEPVILYGRADESDPLQLFRKLAQRLSETDLKNLAVRAFAGYAVQVFGNERGSLNPEQQSAVISQLQEQPELVFAAIKEKELSWSVIVDQQESDLARVQGRVGNFERAISGLLNPDLSTLAYQWLVGQELTDNALKRLGVANNIDDLAEIRTALHVIATLARRAGVPFFTAIDQAELFLLKPDRRLDKVLAGFLRATLEAVINESGFLIVSMNEDAWSILPKDLRQRFGPTSVQLSGLSFMEANKLLAVYLCPWNDDVSSTDPFTADAVKEMLVLSGGNTRRFMQAAHLAFEAACTGQRVIDRPLIVGEVQAGFSDSGPDERTIRDAVEEALRGLDSEFVRNTEIAGQVVDYVVTQDGSAVLLVQISQPVFVQDEAQRAIESLAVLKAARTEGARTILVIVGYSSPEVVSRLTAVAEDVVVANRAEFRAELKDAIARQLNGPTDTGVGVTLPQLRALQNELKSIRETRTKTEREIADRLLTLSTGSEQQQKQQQLKEFRVSWATERQRLYDEIQRERIHQKARDLEEISSLYESYGRDFRSRRIRLTVLAIVAVVSALALVTTFLYAIVGAQAEVGSQVVVATVSAVAAALVAAGTYILGASTSRSSAPNVRSMDDLERVARQLSAANACDLTSPNPYSRYAYARLSKFPSPSQFLSAARSEPSRLIRRELVRAFITNGPESFDLLLDSNLDTASLTVALEFLSKDRLRMAYASALDRGHARSFPPALWTVAAMHGLRPKHDDLSLLESFLLELALGPRAQREPDEDDPVSQLLRAYLTDDDERLLTAVGHLPERDCRRAAALLAPAEPDGLGSYYWLENIGEIDEIYTFFRKAVYASATGLAVVQQPSTSTSDRPTITS